MRSLVIAMNTLGRWTPGTSESAILLVAEAQKVAADSLRAGDTRLASWLVDRLEAAQRSDQPGIAEQLAPLVDELGACIDKDGELASRVMPMARAMGKRDLYDRCAAAAHKGLMGHRGGSRPAAKTLTARGR